MRAHTGDKPFVCNPRQAIHLILLKVGLLTWVMSIAVQRAGLWPALLSTRKPEGNLVIVLTRRDRIQLKLSCLDS